MPISGYPTGSDSAPTAVAGGTGAGTAVFRQFDSQGPADITNAGGLSPYGTMGQGGNAWEWQESAFAGVESRVVRGGIWNFNADLLASSSRTYDDPDFGRYHIGFRVAAVPEPDQHAAAFGVALLGTGVWLRRKKV